MDAKMTLFYLFFAVAAVAIIPLFVHTIRFIWKSKVSSNQATVYWREKFKDETLLQQQQETLLRASMQAESPEILLRSAQENISQQTPRNQLVRPVKGPE